MSASAATPGRPPIVRGALAVLAAFAALVVVAALGGCGRIRFDEAGVTPDNGRENTGGTRARLWQATRPTRDAQFDQGRAIAELADAQLEVGDPSITMDDRHLVYASGPTNRSDLYIADRTCE